MSQSSGLPPLRRQVQGAVSEYFKHLDDGVPPNNLYRLVLQEMEIPLFEKVLEYTGGNQSRAADVLGINRSTLRKKMKEYELG